MTSAARRIGLGVVVAALHGVSGCAQTPAPGSSRPSTTPATPAIATADTTGAALIPAGFGSLRQDAIAITLSLPDMLVRLTPLDESVIRTLSSDSYRALHELADSRRPAITRLAAQHGLLRGSLWTVSFYGLTRDARFSPLDVTITSAGRDYRPVEVIPISSGFGEQRLQPRETQSALYLFEDALDVNQPLVVSLGSTKSTTWSTTTLRTIERERALIQSRAQSRPATP